MSAPIEHGPTERGFARTLAQVDLTIDGLITIANLSNNGLDLLCQLREWTQQAERRVESAIVAFEGKR